MWSLNRRQFLQSSAALGLAAALPACTKITSWGLPITVYLPGMDAGHSLRGNTHSITPSSEQRVKVAILGAGAAGLFAAWRLAKSGFTDFSLIEGPEFGGNCAAGQFTPQADLLSRLRRSPIDHTKVNYPRGAHYLPLPSMESTHIRELLLDMGVIEANPFSPTPTFDERVLVHAPEDRLLIHGQWQEGLIPQHGVPAAEIAEQKRFFQYIEHIKQHIGNDGKRPFCVPLAQSSQDPAWRALDQISFAEWLKRNHYTAPSLLWYLDYACRDDYGINLAQTSAWAGLHYFSSRGGQANNAHEAAVLTWPDGLNPLIRHMASKLNASQRLHGMATRVHEQGNTVAVDVVDSKNKTASRLIADHVICAMPLHVAAHVVTHIKSLGFDLKQHGAHHAPWQVSNFLIHRFPDEPDHHPLAWDNVIYGSDSLGFVNSTHQLIRTAKPQHSVMTAYHAYAGEHPKQVRQRLQQATGDELYAIAAQDLDAAYGWGNRFKAQQYVQQVEITLRGHAMSSPTPGFLTNAGIQNLIQQNSRIQFAHSDLSGLSIFEEAAWWGDVAARRVLQKLEI
ncbi:MULTISPECIES: FAD-dependent oxidoreductase [Deefgea]|uniref:NAD(P)-binding protein n=1 Tax=Deefgea chitinilytica TaxID=570276 RepID=A0ABS2CBV8_9NEIS|nr:MULTISPECIES: FAD-dependent oxidoreductase [Deefgea]MBM5570831.1 NAD(P)-binding protein [Deefgea chitinilytica]MBM9888060.1 FAD-dependent oxidoreductase [Deefgea sp. CFH1-16]